MKNQGKSEKNLEDVSKKEKDSKISCNKGQKAPSKNFHRAVGNKIRRKRSRRKLTCIVINTELVCFGIP